MRRILATIALMTVAAAAAAAVQTYTPATGLVAERPTCNSTTRQSRVFGVTDALSSASCTVGGGSTRLVCYCNGTPDGWVPVGTGAGGGDSITVNSSSAVDPDFLNGDIDWTLAGGNSITATVACSGCVDAVDIGADAVSSSELDGLGVEAEIEGVLDLQDLQGAVTDAQVPNTLTLDLETSSLSNILDDEVLVGTGAGTAAYTVVQNCDDTTGKLDWTGTAWACVTDRAGGGAAQADTVNVGNVGTGEDDLIAESLAGGSLAANGDTLHVLAFGTTAANGNSKRVRCYFGATALADLTSSGSAFDWTMTATVTRTGAATQEAQATLTLGALTVEGDVTFPTETLAGAVTVKCTGEATATDDVVQEALVLELGGGGGGGSSIVLDLNDDASNESAGVTEIATAATDYTLAFSEPTADKLKIDPDLLTAPRAAPDATSIGTPVVWVDADQDDATYADGDPVGTMTNWGSAGDFTASGTARPTFKTSILNGHDVYRFDGTTDCVTQASVTQSTFDLFIVFSASNSSILYEQSADGGTNPGNFIYTSTSNSAEVRRGTTSSSRDVATAWGQINQWTLVQHRFANAGEHRDNRVWVNGQWYLGGTGALGGNNPGTGSVTDEVNIGCRNGASLFVTGDIAEIIVYSPALESHKARLVRNYLQYKYGLW